jgi:hypothetical protein
VTAGTAVVGAPRRLWAPAAVIPQAARWLPLVLILGAQAVLSARLIPTGIPSHDESGYIYAGHQLIHELWHGGGSPYNETYFSGSPVIYPVVAAMADHVGGLVAVRLMSLLFMMTATLLAFATGSRLFGYLSGIMAAGLFAGLGLTQDLGAYATYDAMALMLVAVAAYCAVRAADDSFWLLLVPIALLAANATKYATLLFDPIVIGLAAVQLRDWKQIGHRLLALSLATGSVLSLAAFLAGSSYVKGILFTTLARKAGTRAILGAVKAPRNVIVAVTWNWVGIVLALGVLAMVVTLIGKRDRRQTAIIAVLVVAGMLVTFEGLRLHSDESMRKHDDYGAWFTCIAAGYVLAYVANLIRVQYVRYCAVGLAFCAVAASGAHYSAMSAATYEAGHNVRDLPLFATLKSYLTGDEQGRFLVGGIIEDQLLYMDHVDIPWYDYSNDVYVKYPIPGRGGDSHGQVPGLACFSVRPHCVYLEGPAGYRAAISAHWFTLISMAGNHGIPQDAVIRQTVLRTAGYVLITRIGGAPTWIYAPAYNRS